FASFTTDTVCKGSSTSFAATAVPGALSYDWDFGDSLTDNGQNVSHTYTALGISFIAKLRVTLSGCTDSVTNNVALFAAPSVNFAGQNVCLGEQVNFTNNTTVPDNPGLLGSLSYQWDFGD